MRSISDNMIIIDNMGYGIYRIIWDQYFYNKLHVWDTIHYNLSYTNYDIAITCKNEILWFFITVIFRTQRVAESLVY